MREAQVEDFIEHHRDELISELREEIADEEMTDIEWDG